MTVFTAPVVGVVRANRLVRKMRGGTQAHLIECDDGNTYVVKFTNNPQHRRVLVNELLSSILLDYLDISTPQVALVQLDSGFLKENPEVNIGSRSGKMAVEEGLHFGSATPVDLTAHSVWDFLPDKLLPCVLNREEFVAVLVFDKWAENTDGRQSLFFRSPLGTWATTMIDNGFAFGGPEWSFSDGPLHGLYGRRVVYNSVASLDDFQPWLDRAIMCPKEVIRSARRQIPAEWIEGDEVALDDMLNRLCERRRRIADILEITLRHLESERSDSARKAALAETESRARYCRQYA